MKIPPTYSITSEILEIISKIDANRYFFSSLKISTNFKDKIHRLGTLKSSVFSARIEGNPLTVDSLEKTDREKSKIEIFNILKTINYIDKEIKPGKKISKKIITNLHKIVMNKVGAKPGYLKEEEGAIFNEAGIAVYISPPFKEILNLLDKLLKYINSPKEKFPLVCAFISHLIFEKIHPFLDGNGRVGRLLVLAILRSKNYNFGFHIPFEEYLDEHKDEYYYTIDTGLSKTGRFLLFMLKAFFEETEKIKTIVVEEKKDLEENNLPPRQEEIYKILKEQKLIPFDSIYRRFLKVPKRTLRYDIKKLIDKGFIVKIGSTRGSFYKAK